MPLIDVFKLLKICYQDHELIDEFKNTKLTNVAEFGKNQNCDFNESELIFTTGYLQISKNGNQSTNRESRTSNFQTNVFDNFFLLEDNSNSNVIRRMQADCCIPVQRSCCKEMSDIVNNLDSFLTEIDSNNSEFFLANFIQDESENTPEGDRMRSRNPMRDPVGSIDEIFIDENPDPNDNPELSEAEIEIKWNICKEIIVEVLQEEE